MNLKDALALAKKHYKAGNTDRSIVGLAHTPNSSDGKIQIVLLSYEQEDDDNAGDWYRASVYGGNFFDTSEGFEGFYGNETVKGLIKELPDFAGTLNYSSYILNEYELTKTPEYALKELIPDLPAPDDCDTPLRVANFEATAIDLIAIINTKP